MYLVFHYVTTAFHKVSYTKRDQVPVGYKRRSLTRIKSVAVGASLCKLISFEGKLTLRDRMGALSGPRILLVKSVLASIRFYFFQTISVFHFCSK